MTEILGTQIQVKFSRVVDGDTIRVFLPEQEQDESLRILALDTEESHAGGGKPVTPWGKAAKERATTFFEGAETLTIEFPGNEDVPTCLQKYRGNYGRLLVFVYRDGIDFQETMIREGYSPYFVKYGNAAFANHHQRYTQAERKAQQQLIGVWDQMTVNGSEMRNYAVLGTWWNLRARIIEDYRAAKANDETLYNTRLDYALLKAKAQAKETVTIFTELRSVSRIGGHSGLIRIGSSQQPFSLFIPDIDSPAGQEIVNLLTARYLSAGDDHPGLSYAYVSGELSTYRDRPQMVLTSADQITDIAPADQPDTGTPSLKIVALLPDPVGRDAGNEQATLRNTGSTTVNLQGWLLKDRAGKQLALAGSLDAGAEQVITLPAHQLTLNNTGDDVFLIDPDGEVHHQVSYSAADVKPGQPIVF